MATEKLANDAKSGLNGSINNTQTTLVVNSAATFPSTGKFRIIVDSELMLVTSVSGTTFTVTRGIEGTTAISHSSGVAVAHILTAATPDALLADNSQSDVIASLPAAEKLGRRYKSTDYPIEFYDNGSAWVPYYNGVKLTLPVPASYTWTNGGGTATNTNITNGPTDLSVTSTGAGTKGSVFVKNVPTAPYTATAIFIPHLTPHQDSALGMCLYDGTKFVVFGVLYNNVTTPMSFWIGKMDNLTTYNSDYAKETAACLGLQPMILRITDNNTNRICSFSNDGYHFTDFHSVGRTDFLTPTKIGMCLITTSAATANGVNVNSSLTWLSWTN
jgi:hypothetical protein